MSGRTATVAFLVSLLCGACQASAADTTTATGVTTSMGQAGAECPTEGEEMATAKLYIEHNATDEDTGFHGLFGGEAWSELCIWDPTGRLLLVVDPQGPLGDLRVSDLFFESREPPNAEYSIDDLKSDFPEGEYLVGGTDFEGVPRVALASFSHDIPAAPVIEAPELAEDEESAAGVVVDPSDVVIRWEPVGETIDGTSVEISGYEVIVTKVDGEDPNGWSQPVYDVHVLPGVLSLSVPEEFFESGTLYELEVLALEVTGNQTITVGFFTTS